MTIIQGVLASLVRNYLISFSLLVKSIEEEICSSNDRVDNTKG